MSELTGLDIIHPQDPVAKIEVQQQEPSLEEQAKALQLRAAELNRSGQQLFELQTMMATEGGRELLDIVGQEAFFAALAQVRTMETPEGDTKSLHMVVAQLRPNRADREALYQEIIERANHGVALADEEIHGATEQESIERAEAHIHDTFGRNANNRNIVLHTITDYRAQDNFENSKIPIPWRRRIMAIMNSKPELATPAMGLYYNEDNPYETALKGKLSEGSADATRILYDDRESLSAQRGELREQASKLIPKLQERITEITSQIQEQLSTGLQKLVADSDGLKNFTSQSESAADLLEAVIVQLEQKATELRENATREIDEKTAPLHELISACQSF